MAALTQSQLKRLVDGFVASVETWDDMWLLLVYHLNRDLNAISEPVSTPLLFARVVKSAEQGGWLSDLIAAAREARPHVDQFKTVEAELQAPPAGPPAAAHLTPWQICLIGGALAFIDREEFRATIQQLEENPWPRILVVQGGGGYGKSFSRHFIRHRVEALKHRFVWIDLQRMKRALPADAHIMPEDIAHSLCNQLDLPQSLIPDKDDEQYSRWNMAFCERLAAKVGADQRWWVFVDEFNSVLLPQATTDLFKELAVRVDTVMTSVRLVLLGYEDSLPLDAAQSAHKDVVGPITDDHLAGFFKRVHAMRGSQPTSEQLATHVARVRIKVTDADPRPNKTIGDEAAQEARRLLQEGA